MYKVQVTKAPGSSQEACRQARPGVLGTEGPSQPRRGAEERFDLALFSEVAPVPGLAVCLGGHLTVSLMSSPLDFILQCSSPQEAGGISRLGSISLFCFGRHVSQCIREEVDGEESLSQGSSVGYICPFLEDYCMTEACFRRLEDGRTPFSNNE